MKSRLSLKPGQKGTKLLTEHFGKSLLYVRYRYDEERGVRVKTVELVIEEKPWQPSTRPKNGDLVLVAVEYAEKELREQVKAAGGKGDPTAKMWRVSYEAIKGTKLEKRIHAPDRKGKRS